ncbi:sterile alpha motif domain-containing protein 9-like isoform X2 [Haliotis asinina]
MGHVGDVISRTSENDAFPLYVKSKNTYRICLTGNLSVTQLKGAIEYKDGIPEDLQMLTHHGKLIRPSTLKNLQPDDTIHVIVRSKGGTKGAKKKASRKNKGPGLSNSATEEEVQGWLLSCVKVPEHLIQDEVKYVNGHMLNEYKDPNEIKEELGLPIGLCRKILYLNENEDAEKLWGLSREQLESFTPDHICDFARDSFQADRNLDKITEAIKREHIDGFVIMLYVNHGMLANDLNIKKVFGRRLLLHVKKKLKDSITPTSATNEVSNTQLESHHVPSLDFNQSTILSAPDTANMPFTEQPNHAPNGSPSTFSPTVESITFLQKHLGLDVKENTSEDNPNECQLFAIHSSWEQSNELAQMFLFWILCKEGEFEDSSMKTKLWGLIVQNTSTWLQTLPIALQSNFKKGKDEYRYQFRGRKSVRLGKAGAKMIRYENIRLEQTHSYKYHILILTGSTTKERDRVYRIYDGNYHLKTSIKEITNKMFCIDDSLTCIKSLNFDSPPSKGGGHHDKDLDLTYYGEMKEKYGTSTDVSKTPAAANTKLQGGVSFQRPRPFNQDSLCTIYFKDYVMDVPECGSGMITPSLEFKYFRSSLDTGNNNSPIEKFLTETLRFACGCLNRRRNGTIYFGIADEKPVDGITRRHGQIVGFPIMEVDIDSKINYEDELNDAKSKCFDSPEANSAAKECIKSPVFVKVAPSLDQVPLFVMEVDIEPFSSFCEGIKFKLDLSKISGKKQKPLLFVRDGPETKKIDTDAEELHFVNKLKEWDTKRKYEEECSVSRNWPDKNCHKYLAEKLCRKLCKTSNRIDSSLWPILVSSKPSDALKSTLFSSLTFISGIPWCAVFDFDDASFSNGLCKHFFNSNQTTLTNGDIFRDVENNNSLRERLKLPENNVLIFCNGRSEFRLPHLTKHDWKKDYSPNVKGAINFFQQKSVIPTGRTIVVFLLFATDFHGFLDIFGEMIAFFGSEDIVLICERKDVFQEFKDMALVQQIVQKEDLDQTCVVGMTWEQTSTSVNNLIGVAKQTEICIPTSSGAHVTAEQKFLESIDSLQVLSYSQCEDKTFETLSDKQTFSRMKELKFYQGNRVEWWNFYFQGHVMERHCFQRLKTKVLDALNGEKADKISRVVPIFLNHEPGAGGSTLVRHILWEFRKEFRCAIITKLEEKTASDILSLWRYKEKDIRYARPLLLLIDSIVEQKLDLYEIHRLVTKESWKVDSKMRSPICVFLVCKRDETLHMPQRTLHQEVSENEYLLQKVEDSEKEWLTMKIEQLEDTSRDFGLTQFKGEYFISFMILHSNFKQEFLRDTIHSLMSRMEFEDRSFKLLAYVALIISFVSPPKGGAAIAVPVECCSEHMGFNSRMNTQSRNLSLWENHLEGPLKILLIIEANENGSGKQIRMAHQNLAKAVIECIQTRYFNNDLASIATDFLESDLLKTSSFARTYLNRLCVEMLIRRKKEEYDDGENTKFSPLIESIISESKMYSSGANVLVKGFELMQDGFIAHQLARLHLHHKEYVWAKEWAQKAVELDPKRSTFLHTFGCVYKHHFLSLKLWDEQKTPDDPSTTDALDMALGALGHFQNASTCDKYEKNLLAYFDILSTVNCIARFLHEIVNIGTADVVHRYLTEDNYFPESTACWENYHLKLKALYTTAMDAVAVLDEHIYYSQCSYASKYSHQQNEEHRNSRIIKKRLPDSFQDFVKFFCERENTNDPPPYIRSDVLKDGWHRRRVVALHGKRLVDVFKIVFPRTEQIHERVHYKGNTKKNRKGEKPVPSDSLWTIQTHLKSIKDKNADDCLTLIAVNLALAELKAAKQTSVSELYGYCLQIIRTERRGIAFSMAYLYIMMFMWPQGKLGVPYDHTLMKEAMRFLFDEFRATKQRKPRGENELFKRENNIYHSIALFYLAKGRGLSSFSYHLSPLFFKKKQEEMWESYQVREKLQLVNGYTRLKPNSGTISVIVDLKDFEIDEELELRNFKCRRPEMTERPISFYLGFSLSGPVVCYICPDETSLDQWQLASDYVDYSVFPKEKLRKLLRDIEKIKAKKDRHPKETDLLKDEAAINDALFRYESEEAIID